MFRYARLVLPSSVRDDWLLKCIIIKKCDWSNILLANHMIFRYIEWQIKIYYSRDYNDYLYECFDINSKYFLIRISSNKLIKYT